MLAYLKETTAPKENNKVNGFFMIAFLIAGLIGVYWCNELYTGKTLLAHDAASVQGEKVDEMLKVTLLITGIVFVITQIVLFWFAFKYQEAIRERCFIFRTIIQWKLFDCCAGNSLNCSCGNRSVTGFCSPVMPPKALMLWKLPVNNLDGFFVIPGKMVCLGRSISE